MATKREMKEELHRQAKIQHGVQFAATMARLVCGLPEDGEPDVCLEIVRDADAQLDLLREKAAKLDAE